MRLDNKSENLKYDEDSNKESWENYYIPYYKDILGDEVDLDLEGLHRYQSGTVYRVVAEVKNEDLKKKYLSDGLKKIQWAGDVIINDDDLLNKMEYKNLGLLPVQGGLQLIKKQYGNDKKLSEFVKVINEYYVKEGERVLVKKGSGNIEWRKKVLNYLGLSIDDKKEVEDAEKIYNCCFRLYGIKRDIVDKFLDVETEDDEKNAIDLFWEYRNRRWNEICEKDKSSQS